MIKEMKNYIKVSKLNFVELITLDNVITYNDHVMMMGKPRRIINITTPNSPGVYMYLNANKEVMYIGKSSNLKTRFTHHLNDTSSKVSAAKLVNNDSIKFYTYAICDDVQHAEAMEMLYTYIYKPKLTNVSLSDIRKGLIA